MANHENDFEHSPFADFIKNSLDLSGLQNSNDLLHPEDVTNFLESRQNTTAEGDGRILYDIKIGSANFSTLIDTDPVDSSVFISFPSQLYEFDQREILHIISDIFEAAYTQNALTNVPQVALHTGKKEFHFDLNNYWQGKQYERALAQQDYLQSITYYLKSQSFLPRYTQMASEQPTFMYGFHRANSNSMLEFIKMTTLKAQYMNQELAKMLLERNDLYKGDSSTDAKQLTEKLNALCKAHPPKNIL